MFVSFEGLDGCGKTTQARLLSRALEETGVEVVLTREPGGTPLGERIRDLVLHGDHVAPWAEAALYAAARAQHVEELIRPALARGATVVCDRYVDSSVTYQGAGRQLGVEEVLGLNLTAASYVILFDPWWNPAIEAQAIDRTHRLGQTRTVIAYRLLTEGTVEERIWELQQRKSALAKDLLGEESFARSLSRGDLEWLLSPPPEVGG